MQEGTLAQRLLVSDAELVFPVGFTLSVTPQG